MPMGGRRAYKSLRVSYLAPASRLFLPRRPGSVERSGSVLVANIVDPYNIHRFDQLQLHRVDSR